MQNGIKLASLTYMSTACSSPHYNDHFFSEVYSHKLTTLSNYDLSQLEVLEHCSIVYEMTLHIYVPDIFLVNNQQSITQINLLHGCLKTIY